MKKDPMLSSYLLKDKRTGETFEKEELRAREKAGLKNKDVEIIPRDDLVPASRSIISTNYARLSLIKTRKRE